MFSLFFNFKINPFAKRVQAGFTLIELMVSIAIITLVMSVVIVQQTAFNGSVLLRNEAYELALTLRNLQLSAVSASANNGSFRAVYGAHFNENSPQNIMFPIFKDADNDKFYDSNEAFGQQGVIDSRFEIRDVRVIGDSYVTGSGLSIVFERPNFDARFFDSAGEVNASSVEIDIARKGVAGTGVEVLRTVEVTSAGQISVQ